MKSPWKYLVQLASRGRLADVSENAGQPEAVRPGAQSPLSRAPTVRPTPADNIESTVEPTQGEMRNDFDTAATRAVTSTNGYEETTVTPVIGLDQADDVRPVNEVPSSLAPVRRRGRAKGTGATKTVAVVGRGENRDGDVPAQLPLTFFGEVKALDDEITQLRRQLIEKLTLQNAQLKRMLKRFDA